MPSVPSRTPGPATGTVGICSPKGGGREKDAGRCWSRLPLTCWREVASAGRSPRIRDWPRRLPAPTLVPTPARHSGLQLQARKAATERAR